MQDVSDKLLNQFVACLEQRMAREDAAPDAEAPTEPDAPAGGAAAVPVTSPAAGVTPDPAAPSVASSSEEPATIATPDPAAPAPAATPPAAAPKHVAPAAPARGSDDALDLGATVLPVLAKAYWKQAVGALVVIGVVVWLVTR